VQAMEDLVFHIVLEHLKDSEAKLKEHLVYLNARSSFIFDCINENFGTPAFHDFH
jgi:hypothetical protein